MMRRGDRSSVVLGKGLSTRDGKVVKAGVGQEENLHQDRPEVM